MRSFFNKKKPKEKDAKQDKEDETRAPQGQTDPLTSATSKSSEEFSSQQRGSSPPPPPLRNTTRVLRSNVSESEPESYEYSSETDSDEEINFRQNHNTATFAPRRRRRYESTSGESESDEESETSYESEAQHIRRDPQQNRPVNAVRLPFEGILRGAATEHSHAQSPEEVEGHTAVFPTLADLVSGKCNLSSSESRQRRSTSNTTTHNAKSDKRSEKKSEKSTGVAKRKGSMKKEEEAVYARKASSKDVTQASPEVSSSKAGSRKKKQTRSDMSETLTSEVGDDILEKKTTKPASKEEDKQRLGDGCYLRYDPSNGGTIYAQWSVTGMRPTDALAYFEPKSSVARYKYTTNEGRVDLVTGVSSDPKKYLEAWTQFWGIAREEKGYVSTLDMVNQSDLMLDLWTLDYEGNVNSVIQGKGVNISNVDCLAALPQSSQVFEDVDFVTKSFFVNVAQRCGVNISFER